MTSYPPINEPLLLRLLSKIRWLSFARPQVDVYKRQASHRRLKGRPGQYSTVTEHMPEDHQKYLEWNGDRFRKWVERIGINTYSVVNAILTSRHVEQQTYRSCMGLLKLAEKYSDALQMCIRDRSMVIPVETHV